MLVLKAEDITLHESIKINYQGIAFDKETYYNEIVFVSNSSS